MTDQVAKERLAVLEAFAEAYNRHDVDAIIGFMTEEPTFISFAGPDPDGERFVGAAAVRARVASGLEAMPDAQWLDARHFVAGDRGVSEWTFRSRGADGELVERDGVDLFSFEGNRISVKSTFQKWVQPRQEGGTR